jgi:hypothetical protein
MTEQKITFRQMRAAGVRGVLVYCHFIRMSAEQWPDTTRLSGVCTACGHRGAEKRPDWPPMS